MDMLVMRKLLEGVEPPLVPYDDSSSMKIHPTVVGWCSIEDSSTPSHVTASVRDG
jgi:hypothetical protein